MRDLLAGTELNALGVRHGTDKSSIKHDYLRFYEYFFAPFRNERFALLELGVGPEHNKGKSLYTFRDYFPQAQIVGVDIRPDAADVQGERITVEIGDCSAPEFLRALAQKYRPAVILDDASHLWSHQILAFETLFPLLAPGGLFVIEDVHTSFAPLSQEYGDAKKDTATYLSELTLLVSGSRRMHPRLGAADLSPALPELSAQVDALSFYKHTALMVKKRT